MRIKKIKFKDGQVEIHSETVMGRTTRETVFKSMEKPHPDFELAFSALVRWVYDILELPRDWKTGQVRVFSVSFSMSEDTGVEGAVMSAQASLHTSNSPFSFNTPHLPFEQYSKTGESPLMPKAAVEEMEELRAEAEEYMTGQKRAQKELALK